MRPDMIPDLLDILAQVLNLVRLILIATGNQ